jgi:tRNA(Ile)-lysidine synthase
MRLTKGAGTSELLGLETLSKRKNYRVLRPILHHSKEELLNYLEQNSYHYFVDKSNSEEKYERNYFRNRFSNELITKYQEGIRRSFGYLQEDKKSLIDGYYEIFHYKELYILEISNTKATIRIIDKYLKKLGYLLSSTQRGELIDKNSIVFGGLWVVELSKNRVYIAPYIQKVMPKKFKEVCRVAKIPSKVRGYIFKEDILTKII